MFARPNRNQKRHDQKEVHDPLLVNHTWCADTRTTVSGGKRALSMQRYRE